MNEEDRILRGIFEERLQLEKSLPVWNKVWDRNATLHDVFEHAAFHKVYAGLAAAFDITNPKRVLIIGGSGAYAIKLARKFPDSAFTNLEIKGDGDLVARVKEKFHLKNFTIDRRSATEAAFPGELFNAVVIDALDGSSVPISAYLSKAEKLLAPNGECIVVAVNRNRPFHKLKARLSPSKFEYGFPNDTTGDELKAALAATGFNNIEVNTLGLAYDAYYLGEISSIRAKAGNILDAVEKRVKNGGLFLVAKATKPGDKNEEELIKVEEIIRRARLPIKGDSEVKRVEIVVLNYKNPEVETKCAKHLIENTAWPYKLNLFDNRPGTQNFSKIWNRLIRESTCDYIIIMDSDVFVPKLSPCWLTRMMQTFENYPDAYVVTPRVTNTSMKNAPQRAKKAEDIPPTKLAFDFAGMCVLYKKEIFEKVGYFDEDFLLRGQDTEWAHRVVVSEYSAYLQNDVLVEHIGGYSTGRANKAKEYERGLERVYANTLYNEKIK